MKTKTAKGKRTAAPHLRTPKANANRTAALRAMVKLGWIPGKGWPGGVDPRKGDGAAKRPAAPIKKTARVQLASLLSTSSADAEYEFLLSVARLVVARKLKGSE